MLNCGPDFSSFDGDFELPLAPNAPSEGTAVEGAGGCDELCAEPGACMVDEGGSVAGTLDELAGVPPNWNDLVEVEAVAEEAG
jgi:hypothetical protein